MTSHRSGPAGLGVFVPAILLGLWFTMFETATLHAQAKPHSQGLRGERTGVEETWEVIHISGKRVGYSHSLTRRVQRDGRTLIRTKRETELTIKRFGQELKMNTSLQTNETEDGRLLSYEMEISNPPAGSTRSVGRVEDGELHVETTVAGSTTESTISVKDGVKSPTWQDRVTRTADLKPGQSRSFEVFLPELNQIKQVRLEVDEYDFVKLLRGQPQRLLRARLLQPGLPTVRVYLNDKGQPLKSEAGLLGQTMETFMVSKEEALQAIAGAELDIAVNSLVRVSRIRNPHRTKKAVYRITTRGEDPIELLPTGPTQQVKRISPETAELTVTAIEIPEQGRRTDVDETYLKATRFLQSEDPRIREHARRAVAGTTDPAEMALQMERYVHRNLKEKNFSTALASAAEVAEKLEGDCTEHAVLLAAMLRAKKIPSRIAVGLVYVENRSSFGGHMWTEAYLNGQWVPLDPTLGEGGIGAAHIKLGESSFADDAPAPVTSFLPLMKVLGNIQIRVVDYDH